MKILGQVAVNFATTSGNGILGVLGAAASFMYIGALLDVVLYDMVALTYQHLFQQEASEGDAFWLTPDGVGHDYALMIGISMVASLTAFAFVAIMTFLMPDVAPFWFATALVTVALIMNNLQHYAETYVDQEEGVFGYALS